MERMSSDNAEAGARPSAVIRLVSLDVGGTLVTRRFIGAGQLSRVGDLQLGPRQLVCTAPAVSVAHHITG